MSKEKRTKKVKGQSKITRKATVRVAGVPVEAIVIEKTTKATKEHNGSHWIAIKDTKTTKTNLDGSK